MNTNIITYMSNLQKFTKQVGVKYRVSLYECFHGERKYYKTNINKYNSYVQKKYEDKNNTKNNV